MPAPAYRHRQKNRRRADDSPKAAPQRRGLAPRQRQSERLSASDKLAREFERVAEIDAERRVGRRHLFEEAEFRLVLHIADRERTDAVAAAGQFLAIVMQTDTFDAERRDGVDVGANEKIGRLLDIVGGENLHTRARQRRVLFQN